MWKKLNSKFAIATAVGVGVISLATTVYKKYYKQNYELNAQGFLTIPSVVKIFNQIRIETSKDFFLLVDESRKTRRNAPDLREYLLAVKKFEDSFENLLSYKQKQVLAHYRCDEELFERSIEHYIDNNNQEIRALVTRIFNMLQDAIPPRQKINRDDFFKILRDRIDYVSSKGRELYDKLDETLQQIKDTAPANEDWEKFSLMAAVDNKIGDYIFEKYAVEREDLLAYQKSVNLQEDLQLKQLLDEAIEVKAKTFDL